MPASQMEQFQASSMAASDLIGAKSAGYSVLGNPRPAITGYVSQHRIKEGTYPSLAVLVRDIASQVSQYGSIDRMPAEAVGNTRNDMYLASEAIRFLIKDKESDLSKDEVAKLNAYKGSLDNATRFIPNWVKIAVAIALGLGTMVGWRRIVITVGEKIGNPPDLCARRLRRDHGRRDHRGRRRFRAAGVDHTRPFIRHCRHHDGQRIGAAAGDGAQHRHGLGADTAGRHDDLRQPVLDLLPAGLSGPARQALTGAAPQQLLRRARRMAGFD